MKKVITAFFGLLVLIALVFGAYHFISPKVVVTNNSSVSYDEFVLRLPSSGVSFGPIEPGSKIRFTSPGKRRVGLSPIRCGWTAMSWPPARCPLMWKASYSGF